MKDIGQMVAEHPFFEGLAAEHATLIAGCGGLAVYDPGAYLARAGSPAEHFFLIRHGKVALEVRPPGQDTFILDSVSAGEMMGWAWLYEPYVWQFDARAMDLVRVIEFDGACLRGKCEADPALGYDLMKRFARVMVQRFVDTRLQLMDVYGSRD